MGIGPIEGRARLAITIFFLALLTAIGINLAFYFQSANELDAQKLEQTRLQAALLSSVLASAPASVSDDQLQGILAKYGIDASASLYSAEGRQLARASIGAPIQQHELLTPLPDTANGPASAGPLEQTKGRIDRGLEIAQSRIGDGRVLVLAKATHSTSLPAVFYVLVYQLLALFVGVGVVGLLVRWLLKPYRKVVEAARHSPVRGSPELSESEFVAQTLQALITQLQAKERELAQLHSIERRRAERSERFSERLIANIPSGLVTINSAGQITSANGYASILFGSDEISAEQPTVVSTNEDQRLSVDYAQYFSAAPQLVQLVSECLSAGLYFKREEVDVNDGEGRVRRLGLSISPMTDSSQKVEGALCLLTDITEVTELRERMKVQENLANLGEMAAGLAHEFKNSLAAIQGYVQLLDLQANGSRDPKGKTTREAVLKEVTLLTQLVTDFLNFARPQQLNLADVCLKDVIDDSIHEVQGELARRNIDVRIEGDFPDLRADEGMLRRVFVNLLRNAAEAIPSGGIEKLIEITCAADRSGTRYAHVRIKDTGEGISSENLQHIFIPFFTTKSRGYGIGLALVQKIVIAHGGSVLVEQSDSSGTTFHCKLPMPPISGVREDLSDSVK